MSDAIDVNVSLVPAQVNDTEPDATVAVANFLLTVYEVDLTLSGLDTLSPLTFLILKKLVGNTNIFWSGLVKGASNLEITPAVFACNPLAVNVLLKLFPVADAISPTLSPSMNTTSPVFNSVKKLVPCPTSVVALALLVAVPCSVLRVGLISQLNVLPVFSKPLASLVKSFPSFILISKIPSLNSMFACVPV